MSAGVRGTGKQQLPTPRSPPEARRRAPLDSQTTSARDGAWNPRHPRAAPRREFMTALDTVSKEIRDPVAKLRYMREVLASYEAIDQRVSAVPGALIRRWLYRWTSLEGLQRWVSSGAVRGKRALGPASRRYLFFSRLAALVAFVLLSAGLTVGGFALVRLGPQALALAGAWDWLLEPGPTQQPVARAAVAPVLFAPRGIAPAGVWLVEQGSGWELYSNGLRVETAFTISNDPRRYRVFHIERGMEPGVRERPVGLLFHTSESDIWPLQAAFNENLRDSSQRLLRYLRRKRVYHYLIDRFGRVFRVVDEASKANHAGFSIWAAGELAYLKLNHAFLGVCFETRWEGGLALPITQAQFAAGRNLTEYLRQRWNIEPDMCVAHGLASVNRYKHLIGHHLDWSRGFPFEALGLPNQYARAAPSVALFGFGYDEHFLETMGEPWPGVRVAERMLEAAALREGRSVDEVRQARQAIYDAWIEEQSREEAVAANARRDVQAGRPEKESNHQGAPRPVAEAVPGKKLAREPARSLEPSSNGSGGHEHGQRALDGTSGSNPGRGARSDGR